MAIALDNLIENALVYAPRGTTVTISWSPDGTVAVLDEGPGIPPGEENRSSNASAEGGATGRVRVWDSAIVETLARRWGGTASIRNRETAAPAQRCGCPWTGRPATWRRSVDAHGSPRTARPRARGCRRLRRPPHHAGHDLASSRPAPAAGTARSAGGDDHSTHDDRQDRTEGTTTEDRSTQTDDNSGSGSSGKGRGRGRGGGGDDD